MPGGPRWTEEEEAFLVDLASKGFTNAEIHHAYCAEFGGDRRALTALAKRRAELRDRIAKAEAEALDHQRTQIKDERKGDERKLESPRGRITSLDELLDAADVDREEWDVERYVVNKWEVGTRLPDGTVSVAPLFQVKAWLKRRVDVVALKEAADRIIARMATYAPKPPRIPTRPPAGPHMLEVCSFDLHMGKYGWMDETGEDTDSGITAERHREAIMDLVAKSSGFGVERVTLPIGNDLLHADNSRNTTTKGTPLDVDTRRGKILDETLELVVWTIETLRAIAPVDVLVVPGNHDRESMLSFGKTVGAWFRQYEDVAVDAGPRLRKYVRYGVNLIGYTHGSDERHADLPLIMAQECRDEWAGTLYREWHTGHFHKKKEVRYTAGDEFNGVRVRIIPSLSGTDAWHYQMGYVQGIKAAEAYLWHRETGPAGHFTSQAQPREAA